MWKLERACLNEIESVGVEVTPRHPHKRAILSMFPVYRLCCIDNWLGRHFSVHLGPIVYYPPYFIYKLQATNYN